MKFRKVLKMKVSKTFSDYPELIAEMNADAIQNVQRTGRRKWWRDNWMALCSLVIALISLAVSIFGLAA